MQNNHIKKVGAHPFHKMTPVEQQCTPFYLLFSTYMNMNMEFNFLYENIDTLGQELVNGAVFPPQKEKNIFNQKWGR